MLLSLNLCHQVINYTLLKIALYHHILGLLQMNVDMKWQKLQQKIYLIICRKDIVINKEKVNKKLFELIKKVLETDNIDISTTMDNIPEWDSLKHIQLITSIEEEFNFEVSFEESISMVDVKNILEIVDIKTNS